MARVTPADVRLIFPTDLSDAELQAFIDTAHLLINEELADSGLTEERLTEIELYLSAHLAALADPRKKSEMIAGEWQFTNTGETGMGLTSTHYGQTVLLLDTSGILDKIGGEGGVAAARIEILSDV